MSDLSEMLGEAELAQIKSKLEESIRLRVRHSVIEILAGSLGLHDVQLLTALGVDAKSLLLQIFTEEAQKLIEADL